MNRNVLFAIVFGLVAAACGEETTGEVACTAAEHEGLLCYLAGQASGVGRCANGTCVPVGCDADADCSGGDACHDPVCTAGICTTQARPEGAACVLDDGGVGACNSSHCE